MSKTEKEALIQDRITTLLVGDSTIKPHRGFSKHKLYSIAKQYVEFHYSKSKLTAKAKRQGQG